MHSVTSFIGVAGAFDETVFDFPRRFWVGISAGGKLPSGKIFAVKKLNASGGGDGLVLVLCEGSRRGKQGEADESNLGVFHGVGSPMFLSRN